MTFNMRCRLTLVSTLLLWAVFPGSQTHAVYPVLTALHDEIFNEMIAEKYDALHEKDLNPDAFRLGMLGYAALRSQAMVKNDSLLTIIDFSRPSSHDRFFVINLIRNSVLFKSLVSHGRNSGDLYAHKFSNRIQSHQSALGFYLTGDPYRGGQGYSLLLNGVDTGYNEQARIRGIVIHPAGYATHDYIEKYGRLGRSFGCPALPPSVSATIINTIKGGSVVFGYFPDQVYLDKSVILHNLREP